MPTPPAPTRPTGREIVGLYDVLLRLEPSPVVELNRAVAVAMRDGPAAGLAARSTRSSRAASSTSTTSRTPRAPTCAAALGRIAEARAAYERALALTRQEPERRFLERRLSELPV